MPTHRSEPPEWIETAPLVFSNTIEIAATATEVWQHIADHTAWPEWFEALDSVEVTGAPAGIGGKRKVTSKRLPLHEEFTGWNEGAQFAFAIVKSPLLFLAAMAEDVKIEATDSGCRVTYRQGIEAKKGFGWLANAALKGLDADTATALIELKACAET